ncbi:MAG: hypothetical protein NXI18_19800 [Alphaproteobacteria bacterium]|nr:hypothetical protein [Alphaproteobacteria bacterium]
MEEQKAATGEITRNMQEASQGTQQVSASIAAVKDVADRTAMTVDDVSGSARRTNDEAAAMKSAVDGFISRVQAA